MSQTPPPHTQPPHVSAWLQRGFLRHVRRMLRSQFHSIAIAREERFDKQIPSSEPLIVYGNHPSWWDPLLAHFLNHELFPARQFYAPIDASALAQYRVFGKLGFFAVSLDSASGASAFLKQSRAIVMSENSSLWLTPEGRFVDVRDSQVPLRPGLAHLCSRLDRGWVMPMCMEYVFWEERLPECLCKMGEPFRIPLREPFTKDQWNDRLHGRLRETQQALAALVIARQAEQFECLLAGRKGGGAMYDLFRRVRSLTSGQRYRPSHGTKFE
ncbi:lysophospholipid acyltransferase family protein [Novipirellula artificiosorum]|uniref:Phospholipid/glycerol acyltransferase domain-containing protein n=1 Tax=Novipirellula artificiosorum TaxID=2528016 RepID=A0A5C6E0S9_9BACT|nr:lysophospholipid acyltransferase family protein [Novipirellula artificiosorum]TWU42460.1 hypothetical protein Poly41_07570 [Novipirellula artificiosorum]